jgi:pyridoxal phosphate enzyme (YggS family)
VAYAGVSGPDDITHNLAVVRARIAAACARAGRDPASVELLPISKTVPPEKLRWAIAAGIRRFGENKVQEAQAKAEALADAGVEWSIVGHLQSNKAKFVARFAHEVQSIDRLSVAEALEKRCQAEGRGIDVLLQVNTSGEASKFGAAPADAAALLQGMAAFPSLRVRGFMTLAILSGDDGRVRECFRILRGLRDRLSGAAPADASLAQLSMGMSGDFETAIEEGATIVRVGQAIFGPRALPDSHYWPEGAARE